MIQDLLKEQLCFHSYQNCGESRTPFPRFRRLWHAWKIASSTSRWFWPVSNARTQLKKRHKELGRLSLWHQLSPCSAAQLAQFCQPNIFKKSTATKSLLQQNSMKIEIGHQHQWICRVMVASNQKYSRLRYLLMVKGLVVCFILD